MSIYHFRRIFILIVCLASSAVWAAPKSLDSYLVRPSSQTVKQRQTVQSWATSKDAGAGEKLIEALNDKDPMSRTLAVQGLGALKYAAARPQLASVLAQDPYPEVRQAAALSLRQIEDPAAVDALNKALGDPETNVRLTALSSVGHYRDARSRPFVEALCTDKAPEVRRTAVFTLGRLEDPAAVPVLEKRLKDTDMGVRAGAAQALGDLRSKNSSSVLALLLKDPEKMVQASAARSLLLLGDSAGFVLAKALIHDPDFGVRITAIDGLGWSKDPAAEAELQALLTQTPADSRPAVQEALVRTQQLRKQ